MSYTFSLHLVKLHDLDLNTKPDCRTDESELTSCNLELFLLSTWPCRLLHSAELCWAITKQIHCTFIISAHRRLRLLPAAKGNLCADCQEETSVIESGEAEHYWTLQHREIYGSSRAKKMTMCWFWDYNYKNQVAWFELCYVVMDYLQNDIYNIEHLNLPFQYMIQKTIYLFLFPVNVRGNRVKSTFKKDKLTK